MDINIIINHFLADENIIPEPKQKNVPTNSLH